MNRRDVRPCRVPRDPVGARPEFEDCANRTAPRSSAPLLLALRSGPSFVALVLCPPVLPLGPCRSGSGSCTLSGPVLVDGTARRCYVNSGALRVSCLSTEWATIEGISSRCYEYTVTRVGETKTGSRVKRVSRSKPQTRRRRCSCGPAVRRRSPSTRACDGGPLRCCCCAAAAAAVRDDGVGPSPRVGAVGLWGERRPPRAVRGCGPRLRSWRRGGGRAALGLPPRAACSEAVRGRNGRGGRGAARPAAARGRAALAFNSPAHAHARRPARRGEAGDAARAGRASGGGGR
jgi:hypothetical protein